MIKEEIKKRVDELSPREASELKEFMERAFSIDFTGEHKMFIDDIKDNILEIIGSDIDFKCTFSKMQVATLIENQYGLDKVSDVQIEKWNNIEDVATYVENELENKQHRDYAEKASATFSY
jgi:hypothetical protein